MVNDKNFQKFNEIYDKTYNKVLKFIICKCSNIDDVNDIIQETYVEVFKKIDNFNNVLNQESYILGIASNKIKKHYNFLYKLKELYISKKEDDETEFLEKIPSITDIETIILKKSDYETIWNYLKTKNQNVQKIFYLYYNLDLTIKEIQNYLNLSESYIKNSLYRNLKKLQTIMESDSNEK